MKHYFIINNYSSEKKYEINENITFHPFNVENFGGSMFLFYKIMIAEMNFPCGHPKEHVNSIFSNDGEYFSLDELEVFLSCFQIANDFKLNINELENIFKQKKFVEDKIFPMGIIANRRAMESSDFENLKERDQKVINSFANSTFYQFGAPFFVDGITHNQIEKGIKFYKKIQMIRKNKDKKTSNLLQNILVRYYDAKINDTLFAIASYMGIIEAMFGDKINITESIKQRIPKYLNEESGQLKEFLGKMYELRSVCAHIKYDYKFSSLPDIAESYSKKRILAVLTSNLIEKWAEEIVNGKSRKEVRNSIV